MFKAPPFLRTVWGILALLFAAACSESGTAPSAAVAAIEISPAPSGLVPGSTHALSVTMRDAAGSPISQAAVTWASSNDQVLTVSAAGLISAVSAGKATVTATSGDRAASLEITITPGGLIGSSGGTVTTPDATVTLAIPAGAVAAGTKITVAPAPDTAVKELTVAGTTHEFGPDGTQFAQPVTLELKYDPKAIPAGVSQATLRVAKLMDGQWQILTEAASVDTVTGKVRAAIRSFSTYGVVRHPCASIALTLPQASAVTANLTQPNSCRVEIKFSPNAQANGKPLLAHYYRARLEAGTRYSINLGLGANFDPSLAVFHEGKPVAQSVPDGKVVSSRTVTVTPTATGDHFIEIGSGKFTDGTFTTWVNPTGSYSLSVGAVAVASVVVTPATATLNVGATQSLSATLKDTSGATLTGPAVAWTSSSTGVATVSAAGVVTGAGAGQATITATAGGKSATSQITVVAPQAAGAGYTLELQNYHPDYEKMTPVRLLHAGDTLTTPNGLTQFFRLKLDGQYVRVGTGLAAHAFNFTSVTPPSPFGPDDHKVTSVVQVSDATNRRAVEIPLAATLSNAGYRRVVGSTVRVVSPRHLGSTVTSLKFNPGGALLWNGTPTSSGWSMFGGASAQNWQLCQGGVSSKNSMGYVRIPTAVPGSTVLPGEFLSINADGSVEFTGGPQCPEFGWSVSWVTP